MGCHTDSFKKWLTELYSCPNKKLSCRRQAARRSVSLKGHSNLHHWVVPISIPMQLCFFLSYIWQIMYNFLLVCHCKHSSTLYHCHVMSVLLRNFQNCTTMIKAQVEFLKKCQFLKFSILQPPPSWIFTTSKFATLRHDAYRFLQLCMKLGSNVWYSCWDPPTFGQVGISAWSCCNFVLNFVRISTKFDGQIHHDHMKMIAGRLSTTARWLSTYTPHTCTRLP